MPTKPFIEIPTQLGSEIIDPEDIISIRSNDKSVYIHMENQPEKEVNLSIGKAEKILTHPFLARCHRCYIVNVLKVRVRIKKKSSVKLINDDLIPVSKSYKERFENALSQYCDIL